ncbi:MAG TPA: TIGR02266 family protein [Polyangiaceae bacterium]|nr:TIGR02266 family protein [Polyangiaceae bacterium]
MRPQPSAEDTAIRRVSLRPDHGVEVDDDPRFADEERPTRLAKPMLVAPPSERRTSDRTPWFADLEFGEDAQFFTGLSLDISEGGLFVATYSTIPIGTKLVLCFELPDGTNVEARGEVRWVRSEAIDGERPGVGVAFTDLPADARDRIVALCARKPPLYVDV